MSAASRDFSKKTRAWVTCAVANNCWLCARNLARSPGLDARTGRKLFDGGDWVSLCESCGRAYDNALRAEGE